MQTTIKVITKSDEVDILLISALLEHAQSNTIRSRLLYEAIIVKNGNDEKFSLITMTCRINLLLLALHSNDTTSSDALILELSRNEQENVVESGYKGMIGRLAQALNSFKNGEIQSQK